jgi:hypothetical protein
MPIPQAKKPEPYVPPKPKRREYTMNGEPVGLHPAETMSWKPNASLNEPSDESKHGGVRLREVLPDDVHPDASGFVLEEMKKIEREKQSDDDNSVAVEMVSRWIRLLEGEP